MSAAAVIVIVLALVLLMAMLVAGLRRAAAARSETRAAEVDYHREPFRSHAEATRHEPGESRT